MNKSFLIVFSLFMLQTLMAQQKDNSVILYDKGNASFARKDYRTADSLFTLSLNIAPHPDSYYNRAVCRRQLNDFKGYCLDLKSASWLGDRESSKLYFRQCIKTDTVYKKNGEKVDKTDFEFIEFVKSYKYNLDFEYSKHDTSGKCILSKKRIDNILFYASSEEVTNSMYKGSIDSLINYIKTLPRYINNIKEKNFSSYSYLTLSTDENGKVLEVKGNLLKEDEGEKEIKKILIEMPNWSPAIYNGKSVKFVHRLNIKYYGDVLEIKDIPAEINNGNLIFTVVEHMPEFPGGPMEMMKHIQKNIVYPHSAKERAVSGKCFLKFVINKEGELSDIEILKGISKCPECDAEAIRVVKTMPKWKPGTQNGNPVSVFFNLPINFQLK